MNTRGDGQTAISNIFEWPDRQFKGIPWYTYKHTHNHTHIHTRMHYILN